MLTVHAMISNTIMRLLFTIFTKLFNASTVLLLLWQVQAKCTCAQYMDMSIFNIVVGNVHQTGGNREEETRLVRERLNSKSKSCLDMEEGYLVHHFKVVDSP